jgi:hypothetical protein
MQIAELSSSLAPYILSNPKFIKEVLEEESVPTSNLFKLIL